LFPVFAKVREKARQTSCVSNMKQWGLAFVQYVQDNDETVPLSGDEGAFTCQTPQFASEWWNSIYPYTHNNGIFKCPSDGSGQQNSLVPPGTPNIKMSYLFNDFTSHWWDTGAPNNGSCTDKPAPDTLAAFIAPADTIMLAEGGLWANQKPFLGVDDGCLITGAQNNLNTAAWMHGGWPCDPNQNPGMRQAPFHTGGSNFSFADGHAKWYRVTSGEGSAKVSQIEQVLPWAKHMDPSQKYVGTANPPQWQ